MAQPLRPRAVPQCSACLRSYITESFHDTLIPTTVLCQQVRGAKKLANVASTVPVRLLKDMRTFGRKGAIVPVSQGQMRNEWFPRRMAEYVTLAEQRTLRLKNTPVERDFNFGLLNFAKPAIAFPTDTVGPGGGMTKSEQQEASMFQRKPFEVERLTPERSLELVKIFLPPRLDFYRQPIVPEPEAESQAEPVPETKVKPMSKSFGFGAGAELLAARSQTNTTPLSQGKPKQQAGPQGIYGSVSTHDILVAIRAGLQRNDEAKRVILREEDVKFVGLAEEDGDRVKHVGEYPVEVSVKGADEKARITIRVIAQEIA